MRTPIDIETLKKARKWARKYYNDNADDYIGHHSSHLASKAIEETGKHFGIGFGCEGFYWDHGREGISYLNMGDTYDLTIIFDSRSERFYLSSWGDVVESLEREGVSLD